jgi:hypothetical protein
MNKLWIQQNPVTIGSLLELTVFGQQVDIVERGQGDGL